MTWLLAYHAVVGLALLGGGRRLGRWAFLVGGTAPALAIAWTANEAGAVLDGGEVSSRTPWVAGLGLHLDLRLDAFALLMVVLVAGVGVLVFAYAAQYFTHATDVGAVAGLLTLFAGSMLGVVLSDNLLFLYVCWELTSITSYLLIGNDDEDPAARAAALQALLVTGLGGLAMLGGFVVVGQEAGTYRLSEILADPPTGTTVAVALVFVLLGACTKSAQYPFHSWLPGAMVAPTPISAYLHSAAMVKAGIYLVARLAPAFADVGPWRPLVVVVGLTTMIAGGLRALRPFDLKQVLAFGTISQLGFMFVLLGIGRPEATAAGCALLLAHAFFKAPLFMVVGIVDHAVHTRDLRQLPALGAGWRVVQVVAILSAASMAAVPPLAGFLAKEEAYAALAHGSTADRLVLIGIVTGSVLTVAYSARFVAALTRPQLVGGGGGSDRAAPGPSLAFVAPAAVLAACTVVLGIAPWTWDALVDHASLALDAGSGTHLALWHGLEAPLVLSLLTLASGAGLFALRRPIGAIQGRLAPPVSGGQVYDGVLAWTLRGAARVTSVTQSGSLPIYAAIILATAAVLPGIGLLGGDWWPGWPTVIGRWSHVPVAALLVGAAAAATVVTRRFAAALLLGAAGYGMAVFFVLQGAPDLALTQVGVETLSVVVFLLVLRRLPDRFERRPPAVRRIPRLVVSGAVGLFVATMAIASAGARTAPPVSEEMSRRALADGDGRNVVNVILVDIRGLDTMGEVTVLVAAAVGIVALARAGQRPRRGPAPRRTRTSDEVG